MPKDVPRSQVCDILSGGLLTVMMRDDRSSSDNKPRREPRFPVDTRVTVNHAEQTVSGQAVEVSQSGIAILTVADQQREHIVNWCRGMTHHI